MGSEMCIRDRGKMKALIWHDEELGANWDEIDIPADMAEQAAEYRAALLETIATSDDEVMEKYLAGEAPVSYTHLTPPPSVLV